MVTAMPFETSTGIVIADTFKKYC